MFLACCAPWGARRRLVERSVVVEAFAVTLAGAGAGVVLGTVFQFVAVRLAATSAGFPAEFALTPGPSLTAAGAGLGIAAVGPRSLPSAGRCASTSSTRWPTQ